MRQNVGVFFASIMIVVFAALGVEGVVRLLLPPIGPESLFVTSGDHLIGESNKGVFEFDPVLIWRLKPNLRNQWWDYTFVSSNAERLRMNRELHPKEPETFRILCLGDSITFGYRVPVVFQGARPEEIRPELSYCDQIVEKLQAIYPRRHFDAVPLGVPGYTSYQGRLWLEEVIDDLHPDLVIVQFGYNDTTLAPGPYRLLFPNHLSARLSRRLVSESAGLLHLLRWLNGNTPKDNRSTRAVSSNEQSENILAISALAHRVGARVLVLGQIYQRPDARTSDQIGNDRTLLGETCRAAKLPFLVIPELTERGWPANQDLFGEAIHPNSKGHELLATRIVGVIEQAQWLR